jgi:DNA helicase IV
LSKSEYAAVTGYSIYDKEIVPVFEHGATPDDVPITEVIKNTEFVSGIPAELTSLKKKVTETLAIVDKAIESTKKVSVLRNGNKPVLANITG